MLAIVLLLAQQVLSHDSPCDPFITGRVTIIGDGRINIAEGGIKGLRDPQACSCLCGLYSLLSTESPCRGFVFGYSNTKEKPKCYLKSTFEVGGGNPGTVIGRPCIEACQLRPGKTTPKKTMPYLAQSGMKMPDQTEQTDSRDYPNSQPYPQNSESPQYGRASTNKMAGLAQLQDKISKYSYDGRSEMSTISSDRYAPSTDVYDIATYNLQDTDRSYRKGGAAQSSYQVPDSDHSHEQKKITDHFHLEGSDHAEDHRYDTMNEAGSEADNYDNYDNYDNSDTSTMSYDNSDTSSPASYGNINSDMPTMPTMPYGNSGNSGMSTMSYGNSEMSAMPSDYNRNSNGYSGSSNGYSGSRYEQDGYIENSIRNYGNARDRENMYDSAQLQ